MALILPCQITGLGCSVFGLKTGIPKGLQAGNMEMADWVLQTESSRPPTSLLLPGKVSLCEELTYRVQL